MGEWVKLEANRLEIGRKMTLTMYANLFSLKYPFNSFHLQAYFIFFI